MNHPSKLCCQWRQLIWDCLAKQDQSEWFKVVQGWYRCGKLNTQSLSIDFPNCQQCQQLFTKFFPSDQSLEQRVALVKQMGCCQLLPMIYDLDDNTVPENVEFYHSLFTNSMCRECREIIDLAHQKKLYQTKNYGKEK